MRYKNGREAKPGDKVVSIRHGTAMVGLLHAINEQTAPCTGRLAVSTVNDPYVRLCDCLHVDDIAQAEIPISTN